MKRIIAILFLALIATLGFGQEKAEHNWKKELKNLNLQPVIAFQLWSTYTAGAKVFNSETGLYERIDNRFTTQLRRSRVGVKGEVYGNLKFNLTAALDLVGRDVFAGTAGGSNNGSSPQFRAWNAYLQWRLLPKKEKLNIVVGYFTPLIGRESITSAMRVASMEKSWSQNYLRRHLTGIGPGRAMGLNIGGLLGEVEHSISFRYDLGLFNPVFQAYAGNSTGYKSSPLMVGRFLVNFGDPESDQYTIVHKGNYFGKRYGLAIAFSGARQGATALFQENYAAGIDVIWNWGNWNLDGEWTYLWRTGQENDEISSFTLQSSTAYLRCSRNFVLKNDLVLEPVLMLAQFRGALDKEGQTRAALIGLDAGTDIYFDAGVNFYFNPDLKISFHATLRSGQWGAAGEGAMINSFFFQKEVGAIQGGNWFGLGLVAIF